MEAVTQVVGVLHVLYAEIQKAREHKERMEAIHDQSEQWIVAMQNVENLSDKRHQSFIKRVEKLAKQTLVVAKQCRKNIIMRMVKFVKDKLDKLEFELNAINGLALGIQLQLTAAAAAERKEKHATQAPGGSSSEMRDIYISFASGSGGQAQILWNKTKQADITSWFNRDKTSAMTSVTKAIHQCQVVVVLLSHEYVNHEDSLKELNIAINRPKFPDNLILLEMEGDTYSSLSLAQRKKLEKLNPVKIPFKRNDFGLIVKEIKEAVVKGAGSGDMPERAAILNPEMACGQWQGSAFDEEQETLLDFFLKFEIDDSVSGLGQDDKGSFTITGSWEDCCINFEVEYSNGQKLWFKGDVDDPEDEAIQGSWGKAGQGESESRSFFLSFLELANYFSPKQYGVRCSLTNAEEKRTITAHFWWQTSHRNKNS